MAGSDTLNCPICGGILPWGWAGVTSCREAYSHACGLRNAGALTNASVDRWYVRKGKCDEVWAKKREEEGNG